MSTKCCGLSGLLLGHDYVEVTETNYLGSDLHLTAEEIEAFSRITLCEDAMNAYVDSHEKQSEKYLGHRCTRCGDFIPADKK